MFEVKIDTKIVRIYYTKATSFRLPIIFLNCYDDNTDAIYDECLKEQVNDFILVTISNLDWDNEMTPYYASKIFKNGNDYLGNSDKYLEILEKKIVPLTKEYVQNKLNKEVEYMALAGYSLGGLFAIYACYKTNLFTAIISASGSFWYPNFIEYIKENNIAKTVEKIYFSLGNKESKTNNSILMTVEDKTKELKEIYDKQGIMTIYEENVGNHFQDANLRIVKGIKWLITHL